MSVVAEKPRHGLRLVLTLDRAGARYEGTARTANETWNIHVSLDPDVTVETPADKDVADWIRRVVRIAIRDAKSNGTRLPRQIQRWRAEKD